MNQAIPKPHSYQPSPKHIGLICPRGETQPIDYNENPLYTRILITRGYFFHNRQENNEIWLGFMGYPLKEGEDLGLFLKNFRLLLSPLKRLDREIKQQQFLFGKF